MSKISLTKKIRNSLNKLSVMTTEFSDGYLYKIIIISLAFFMGLGLFNYTGIFLVALVAFSFVVNFFSKRLIIDRQSVFILFFSVFFTAVTCFWKHHYGEKIEISYLIQFLICPSLLYSLGISITHSKERMKSAISFAFVFVVAWLFGLFMRGFLSIVINITYTGFIFSDRRYFEVWTKVFTNSTLLTTFFYPICGLFITYCFIRNKKGNPWFYLFLVIAFAFCIFSFSSLAVRSPFLNSGFLLIILALYSSKNANEKVKTAFIIIFLGILAVLLIFVILVYTNAFGIQRILEKIPVLMRFFDGGSNSERMSLYKEFFKKFLYYPFGNLGQSKALGTSYFTHNVWLDTYAFGGVFSFVPLFLLTINEILIVFKLLKMNNKNKNTTILLFLIIVLFQVYMFEPVIQGNPYVFLFQFVIFGIVDGIYFNMLCLRRSELFLKKAYNKINVNRLVQLGRRNFPTDRIDNSVVFTYIDDISFVQLLKVCFRNNLVILGIKNNKNLKLFLIHCLFGSKIATVVVFGENIRRFINCYPIIVSNETTDIYELYSIIGFDIFIKGSAKKETANSALIIRTIPIILCEELETAIQNNYLEIEI